MGVLLCVVELLASTDLLVDAVAQMPVICCQVCAVGGRLCRRADGQHRPAGCRSGADAGDPPSGHRGGDAVVCRQAAGLVLTVPG